VTSDQLDTLLQALGGGHQPRDFRAAYGLDPRGGVRQAVEVRGARGRETEGEAQVLLTPGTLRQLHASPALGGLAVFLDHRDGQLAWRWASHGDFPLLDLLGASFGHDLVSVEARPPVQAPLEGCLMGVPLPVPTPEGHEEPAGLDHLLSALTRHRAPWSLSIWAWPVADPRPALAEVRRPLAALRALRDARQRDPDVEEAAEQLTQRLRRLGAGRKEGLWRVSCMVHASDQRTLHAGLAALGGSWPAHAEDPHAPTTWHTAGTGPLPETLLGSSELARLLQPPRREWPGFQQLEEAAFDLSVDAPKGPSLAIGRAVLDGAPIGPEVFLGVDGLTRHALIAGLTGSGKTNTIHHLLLALQEQHGVPFLVVEPAKTEYRRMLRLRPETRLYTPGLEQGGFPLRMNPLDVPRGTPPGVWIDHLLALLQATFELYPPMPYVLQTAVHELYAAAGWEPVSGRRGRTPGLEELVDACDAVVDRLGYDKRIASDVKAALRGRLETLTEGSRGLVYAAGAQTPDEQLFSTPCVVELDALPRSQDKAFAMGLLVLRLACFRRWGAGQGAAKGLRHILVLEEAHRLLREPTGGESAETQRRGVEQLSDLISEIRAYGQGVVVADQIPTRLAEDAVKNTDLKLLHRLVADDDRELVGGAIGANDAQRAELLRLRQGRAAFFQEPHDRPVLVQIPLVPGYDDAGAVLTDDQVARHMSGVTPAKPYRACAGCALVDTPCGPTLALARQAADTHRLRGRAAALGSGTLRDLAICLRATVAARATRAVGTWMRLGVEQEAQLVDRLVAGDAVAPPESWGTLPASLADADALWHRVATPEQALSMLRALRERVRRQVGPLRGSSLRGLVQAIADHELHTSLPAEAEAISRELPLEDLSWTC